MRRLWVLALVLWGVAAHALPAYKAEGGDCASPPRDSPLLQVRVRANEVHGLLYLLESLRGEAHHSRHLAEVFQQRRGAHPEDDAALDAFRQLVQRSAWVGTRLPGDGEKQRGLSDVLEVLALEANDSADFLQRAQAVLNVRDWRNLALAVRHFGPLYRLHVWQTCQRELQAQADGLCDELIRQKFSERLGQAAAFYGSQWPAERDFWVALVPIPCQTGEKIVLHGHSDGFLEVVEVPSGGNPRRQVPVVFHEICHSLWNLRAPEVALALREAFMRQGSWGRLAYFQLNEGLATALGNGWYQSLVLQKRAPGAWYQDAIIDGFAQVLYDDVKERVENGRGCDAAFVELAVSAFRQRFPDAESDCNVRLREVVLVSAAAGVHDGGLQNRMGALGPMRAIFVVDPGSLAKAVQAHPDATLIYLLEPGQPSRCVLHDGRWELSVSGTLEEVLEKLAALIARGKLTEGPL